MPGSELSKSNEIVISSSIDKRYLPYFGVMLRSLLKTRNPVMQYRIVVLSFDLSDSDLNALGIHEDGVIIELHNPVQYFDGLEGITLQSGFPKEILLRLVLPDLLKDVDKVIYLDSDLVVLDDISKLYSIDLSNYDIAGVTDIGIAGMAGGYEPEEKERLAKLEIMNPYSYFCSGVLVWNLARFRERLNSRQLIDWVIKHNPRYADQDCLNYFFQRSVLQLDMRWNTLFDSEGIRVSKIAPYAPSDLYDQYLSAREAPSIFHFAGPVKPWLNDVDGSFRFWDSARDSPLYEQILLGYIRNITKPEVSNTLRKIWTTFDDLYFKSSEQERIVHDLHLRLTSAEEKIGLMRQMVCDQNRLISEQRCQLDDLSKQVSDLGKIRRALKRLKERVLPQ